jgi:pimeloyl-ACP methyl ester carboxylesterase
MKTTSILAAAALALAATTVSPAAEIHYKTVTLPEASIFYREAGDPSKPVILLLHGFPTSSHMFRNLIPELSGDFHVIAPDLPGFGFSSAPDHEKFQYTFDHLAEVMATFVEKLKLEKFSIYIFDYGAPVGLRLALKYPDRITGIITQNGNAYVEGLSEGLATGQGLLGQADQGEPRCPAPVLQRRNDTLAVYPRREG